MAKSTRRILVHSTVAEHATISTRAFRYSYTYTLSITGHDSILKRRLLDISERSASWISISGAFGRCFHLIF